MTTLQTDSLVDQYFHEIEGSVGLSSEAEVAIARQIKEGDESIIGTMIESNINGGNQPISKDMEYGVSVTDACLDWDNTKRILLNANDSLK